MLVAVISLWSQLVLADFLFVFSKAENELGLTCVSIHIWCFNLGL